MYEFTDVDTYLQLLSGTETYTALATEERQKLVFTAFERLSSFYSVPLLAPKIIALQTLYMADSAVSEETAELQLLKRAGAKSYSLSGVSVTFDDSGAPLGISPEVAAILAILTPSARVGRLI